MSECQCQSLGFCPVFQFDTTKHPRYWQICRGEVLTPELCAGYRAKWRRKLSGQPPPAKPPPVRMEPVGDCLAEFFDWLGQVKSISCGCARLQQQMNHWGVAGCNRKRGQILERICKEAWKRGIPLSKTLLRPILNRAIRLAKQRLSAKISDTLSPDAGGTP